jgi:hypothetical protein
MMVLTLPKWRMRLGASGEEFLGDTAGQHAKAGRQSREFDDVGL